MEKEIISKILTTLGDNARVKRVSKHADGSFTLVIVLKTKENK